LRIFTAESKRVVWYTLAANVFIVIAAGHGIGFLGLMEVIDFPYVTEGFTLSLNTPDHTLFHTACLFSAAGTLLLLTSFLIRGGTWKLLIRILALIAMWVGFFYLIHNFGGEVGQNVAIVTGIPFLALSVILFAQSIIGIIKSPGYNRV